MAEQLTLGAPTGPTTTVWRVRALMLKRGLSSSGGSILSDPGKSVIQAWLLGENNCEKLCQWNGITADALIVALNKANLSTNSLEKRVLNQAVVDGFIAGTISGNPD